MKNILYNLSIRQKIIAVLTLFAVSIVIVLSAIDIYFLRQEKRREFEIRLQTSKRSFLTAVERIQQSLVQIANTRMTQPPLIESMQRRDPVRLQ